MEDDSPLTPQEQQHLAVAQALVRLDEWHQRGRGWVPAQDLAVPAAVLVRLGLQRLVEWRREGGQRQGRRCYRLTPHGRDFLAEVRREIVAQLTPVVLQMAEEAR